MLSFHTEHANCILYNFQLNFTDFIPAVDVMTGSLQVSVEQATSVQMLCRTVRLLSVCSFLTVCSPLPSVYNDVSHNSLTLACPLLACFAVFNMP